MAITRYGAISESAGRAGGALSHAEGAGVASGTGSHAEGAATVNSTSNYGHAEGFSNQASANYAHVEGQFTSVDGVAGHAEGVSSYVSSIGGHAEGNTTTASGNYAHAEGNTTQAIAIGAHSEGFTTTASGQYSHAEGNQCTASGNYSHAEGGFSTAASPYSQAAGYYAHAIRPGQRAHNALNGLAGSMITGMTKAQVTEMSMVAQTTNATATVLTTDGGSASVSATLPNVYTMMAKWTGLIDLVVVARRTDTAGYLFTQRLQYGWGRDATGSARLFASPTITTYCDAAASGYTVALSVDTTDATYNYLRVTVTGTAAHTINWFAHLSVVETLTA